MRLTGFATRSKLAALGRDVAVVVGVTLLLVIGLELGLRAFFPQSLRHTSVRGERFSEPDPELGLRYVPGAVWRFDHPEYSVEYAINGDGFRDATSRPAVKPPGTLRVLLLGDSFTFGQGVEYEETWPALAGAELARGSPRVDLINVAMQGMDTRSELILLRRLATRHDVDAVVLGFLINDLYTNVPLDRARSLRRGAAAVEEAAEPAPSWSQVRQTVFRRAADTRTFHLLTLARRALIASDAAYVSLYLAAPARGEYLRPPLPPAARRQLAVTERLMEQVAAFCDSLGKPLVVFSIPQQFQVLYQARSGPGNATDVKYYDRHFAKFAERTGFTWVATLDALTRAAAGRDELFHRLDGHLTPAGNAAVAEAFLQQVIPLLLGSGPATAARGGQTVR
jgi:lysophospholipase L1-like esterase